MTVYVVVRITDANGKSEFEPLSCFSTVESADKEANVLGRIYNVEVHELELDEHSLVPDGTATVANGN